MDSKKQGITLELKKKDIILYMIVIVFVLLGDQLTKYLADRMMILQQSYEIIDGFFYFTYVHNTGAAWSILQGGSMWFFYITTIIALIAIAYFFVHTKPHELLTRFGLVLVVGGALGNFLDRLMFGYVRDFIHFYIFNYDFPIFNIADVAVCLGLGLVILEILIQEYRIWKLSKELSQKK